MATVAGEGIGSPIALAWAMTRYTRYLQGTGTASALNDVFGPLLALTWAYLAMMRILIP